MISHPTVIFNIPDCLEGIGCLQGLSTALSADYFNFVSKGRYNSDYLRKTDGFGLSLKITTPEPGDDSIYNFYPYLFAINIMPFYYNGVFSNE